MSSIQDVLLVNICLYLLKLKCLGTRNQYLILKTYTIYQRFAIQAVLLINTYHYLFKIMGLDVPTQ